MQDVLPFGQDRLVRIHRGKKSRILQATLETPNEAAAPLTRYGQPVLDVGIVDSAKHARGNRVGQLRVRGQGIAERSRHARNKFSRWRCLRDHLELLTAEKEPARSGFLTDPPR